MLTSELICAPLALNVLTSRENGWSVWFFVSEAFTNSRQISERGKKRLLLRARVLCDKRVRNSRTTVDRRKTCDVRAANTEGCVIGTAGSVFHCTRTIACRCRALAMAMKWKQTKPTELAHWAGNLVRVELLDERCYIELL